MNKEIFIKCLNSIHTDKDITDVNIIMEKDDMYYFEIYYIENDMKIYSPALHSLYKSTYEHFESLENLKDTKRKIDNINE